MVMRLKCNVDALGVQEYVEAVSFQHYIRHRSLISLEEINARLVFIRGEKVEPKVHFEKTETPMLIYDMVTLLKHLKQKQTRFKGIV